MGSTESTFEDAKPTEVVVENDQFSRGVNLYGSLLGLGGITSAAMTSHLGWKPALVFGVHGTMTRGVGLCLLEYSFRSSNNGSNYSSLPFVGSGYLLGTSMLTENPFRHWSAKSVADSLGRRTHGSLVCHFQYVESLVLVSCRRVLIPKPNTKQEKDKTYCDSK